MRLLLRKMTFAFLVLGISWGAQAALWPFDQRQVLLVQIEGTEFPDSLTTAQVLDVFVERGRVRWITQKSGPGSIAPIFVPADFPWNRSDSVRTMGLRYKADGVVVLTAKNAQVDLRWYAVSDGQPLYFESLYLPASSGTPEQDAERRKRLRAWLTEMWDRIPGQGYVVKRDLTTLDIEGAANEGLRVGDELSLLRLKDIRRHPVLKTLVGFDSAQTGTATLSALGKPFSQAKVVYESDLDPIREGDRYVLKPRSEAPRGDLKEAASVAAKAVDQDADDSYFGFGFGGARVLELSPRLGLGLLNYEERVANQVYKLKTLSLSYGFRADLHLTSAWFAALQWDQGTGTFGTPPADYEATSLASGWSHMHLLSGYRMPLSDYAGSGNTELHFFGGYSRLGFKAEELSSAVAPTAKTYSGLNFGLSVHVPLHTNWVAEVGFTRMLGAFLKEDTLTSASSSTSSAWSFWTKVRIKATEDAEFGGAYEVYQGSSNFEGSGTRETSALSSKVSSQRTALYYKHMF
jgi:hypothetical protein